MTASMKDRAKLTAWAVAGVVAVTAPAFAEETVLAASKARKLQVLAEGGAAWCKPTVRLRMVLDSDSPDVRNPASQVEIMNRLKTPITTDCKTATAAELTVFEQGKPTGTYKATADKDWVFATAPASAPVAAPKAEPPLATTAAPVPPPAPAAPPAPVAPQVTAAAPQPAPASAPPAAPPLPRDVNYASAAIRLVKDNPSLAQDDGLLRCWAAYRFEKEYAQFRNQEFKLQPVLQKARADLAETVAQSDGQRVVAVLNASFENYNFDTQQFPIHLKMDNVSFSRQCYTQSEAVPNSLTIKVPDLDSITGLPMESKAAQAFADKRTRYGSIDRRIAIALTIKLESGFAKGGWFSMVASGTLESATIYADADATQPLYWLTPEELDKMRAARAAEKAALAKAEEERKAEQRRQQMLAQREQNIRALSSASTSVKLANWVSEGQIDYYTKLNNLRAARAAALVGGKPVTVSMLIQADGSGRNKVDTKWPGKLEVTVAEGQPDLNSSGWYLVRGLLSVPEGDPLPPAQLTAQTVYACAQPKCADATDPTAIVDRKLAALTGAN